MKLIAWAMGAALGVGFSSEAQAEWKPTERIETYPVSGKTPIELYRSIGENGPKLSLGPTIAYTTFDLKWSRKYVPEGGGCRLARAVPHLTIIYKLPKPSGPLPSETKARWDKFIAGITAHERVHGEMILDMVKKIEATSIGLTVADDPKCQKIRQELTKRLAALSDEQRRKSREFDREEMSEGGNVHRLVLGLVNG
jgi:predicted secreted Zn-dependent protease